MAEKFYSSRLLNYVEPVNVGGFTKTAFYTEINTNLKPGDRVFIQNGNYDSDEFIDRDRYAKYVDGYRVISIDRCRIVLDIDYSALKPYQEDSIDNFIKVWPVRDERELRYFDSITIDSYSDRRYSKFHHKQTNNILFSAKSYNNIQRSDASVFSLLTTNGFWAKESNGNYQFINYDVINNTFGMTANGYFNNGYYLNGFSNNGRLFIYGEDFEFNGKIFKQRNIYKYQDNEWIIDTKYKPAIISKLNFRDGRFKGTHFDGVWGTYQKSLSWSGTFSNWLSGVFVNSNWLSGNLNSKSTIASQSFYASLNSIGSPIQTSDFSNNKGHGYNYILDSNVYRGTISDGNFINCNIGSTISSSVSTIDDYYNSVDSYQLISKGGFYNFCDIFDSKIDDATILDSRVYNSNLSKTRLLNSQFYDVVASGEFDAENGIKVLSADIYSYIPGLVPGNPESDQTKIRGVLKLYIPESDLLRLDTFDNFYITKINKNLILGSLSSDQKVILPYETKYILDSFYNSDFSNLPLQATIKMSSENKFKPYVTTFNSSYFNTYQPNGVTYSSLDLDLGEILAHYYQGVGGGGLTASNPTFIRPETERVINHLNVNGLFSNTVLSNADFVSGLLQNVDWVSGAMINRQSNIINSLPNSRPAITVDTFDNTLTIQLPSVVSYLDNTLRIGKNIWLDSIYHESGQNLSGRYKVVNISDTGGVKYLTLEPQDFLVNSLASDVFFFDDQINPNFLSINQAFIKDSKILSGLFKRSLITNTIFYNESFNNQDRDISISNVERLRITKTVFKNNLNDVRSGLFYRNHFFGGTWSSGLAYEVIWKGPTFSSGTFKSGYWRTGTFNGGKFVDSLGTSSVTLPFSSPDEIQSWRNGTFNGGEFDNSVWRDGTFNNGKFLNSDWFAGTWQNGILGDSNIPEDKTTMSSKTPTYDLSASASTVWMDGVVENATVGGDGAMYWFGGKFNRGQFTSNGTIPNNRESIWYGGEFNGGEFTKLARWKKGTFNGGYFNSYYGWTLSNSQISSDYSWESGEFNGGKFGNAGYGTNSTWYNGIFNDGIFQGRVWNEGLFIRGNFNGGATWSSINNESNFVNSFTNSFYGLWRNGIVLDVKTNIESDEKFYTPAVRTNEVKKINTDSYFKNMLWLDGEFMSNSAEFDSSIWLKGKFSKGRFINSSFNPFVNRSPFYNGLTSSLSFDLSTGTIWINGDFMSGRFYISQWQNGTFFNGTMSGGIWKNGTWNYGDAYNVYWEDGRWRNGNWYGSHFDYTKLANNSLVVDDEYTKQILFNVQRASNSYDLHIWNCLTYSTSAVKYPSIHSNNLLGYSYDTNALPSGVPYVGFYTPTISIDSPVTVSGLLGYTYVNSVAPPNRTTANSVKWDFLYEIKQPQGWYSLAYSTGINGSNFTDARNNYRLVQPATTTVLGASYSLSVTFGSLTFSQCLLFNVPNIEQITTFGTIFYVVPQISNPTFFNQNGRGYRISITCRTLGTNLSQAACDFYYHVGNSLSGSTYQGLNTNVGTRIVGSSSTTFEFTYFPSNPSFNDNFTDNSTIFSSNSSLWLSVRKRHSSVTKFEILSMTVNVLEPSYLPINNTKRTAISGSTIQPLPDGSTYLAMNVNNSNSTGLYFGSGAFLKGTWENGVWNSGWWQDTNLKQFTGFTFIKLTKTRYLLTLTGSSGIIPSQLVGRSVSFSNIVGIDINQNRVLLKNSFRVIESTSTSVVVLVPVSFDIFRFEKDDNSKDIFMTSINWLGGVFLNGRFEGIMNYGLIKGNNQNTQVINSNIIDCIIDGGYVGGTRKLIQNMEFYDGYSIVTTNYDSINTLASYNTWIDFTENLYENVTLYDDLNYLDNDLKTTPTPARTYDGLLSKKIMFLGKPFYDVMSSKSYLSYVSAAPPPQYIELYIGPSVPNVSVNSRFYNLGSRLKRYSQFIGDDGLFKKPFVVGPGNSSINSRNFYGDGWTFSRYSSGNLIWSTSPTFSSNNNTSNLNTLRTFYGGNDGDTRITILNNNNINIESQRYTLLEFEISSYNSFITASGSNLQDYTWTNTWLQPKPIPTIFFGNFDTDYNYVNHAIPSTTLEPRPVVKKEYFYNRERLDMYLLIGGGQTDASTTVSTKPYTFDVRFRNIKFTETDQIPFFKYFESDDRIDRRLKLPLTAKAPIIDYSNKDFNFIDSVSLSITTVTSSSVSGGAVTVSPPPNVIPQEPFIPLPPGN